MRIALLPRWSPADAGGGHTFEAEIVAGVLRLAGETQHEFVVYGLPDDEAAARPRNVFAAPLPGNPLGARIARGLAKSKDAARRRLQRLRGAGAELAPPLDGWARAFARDRVEFAFAPGPSFATLEVPFALHVWDLQHRLQPFFPEVSSAGVWQQREHLYATMLRRAAYVFAATDAGRRELELFYQVPGERIRVVPHPTPAFALTAEPGDARALLARLGLTSETPYVFYPAQFWPHKNHVTLLAALRALAEDHGIAMHAILTGSDKGNRPHVEATATRLGVRDRVHFPGFVEQHELIGLYRGARALAYPSLFGPENLPPLEAFALGCPVVAADVAGASEQLGEAALRVPGTDAAAFARSIARVHRDDTLRNDLIARGRSRAESFTGDHYVRAMFQLFDDFEPFRRTWPAPRP